MAAATDKFKKLSRRLVTQVGAGGVADGVATTIPLSSVTNLPIDTAVVVVIDRVDANGAPTTGSIEETVIGVVSGSNLINCVRGAEGTAAAHNAGAVVEVLVTAKGWNDLIDGLLVEHDQDGTHSNITASIVSAGVYTGSGVDTDVTLAANSDTKIASQKATKTYVDSLSSSSSGWIDSGETWTYAAADSPTFTFTISGDKTTKYSAGMRIKLTQTTTKYFIITNVSYSAPDTTVTIYGGTDYTLANAAITTPTFSIMKAPFGFPLNPDKWTVEVTDTTNRSQSSPTASTWYNPGSISITIPIGVWNVEYYVTAFANSPTETGQYHVALNSANNAGSLTDHMTSSFLIQASTGGDVQAWMPATRSDIFSLTSKTPFYINIMNSGSATSMGFRNDRAVLVIRSICAYL